MTSEVEFSLCNQASLESQSTAKVLESAELVVIVDQRMT